MVSDPDDTHARAPGSDQFAEQLHVRGERVEIETEHIQQQAKRLAGRFAESEETKPGKRKLREQARQYGALCIAALVDMVTDSSVPQARLGAIKELLDRGYGKSVEIVEVDDKREAVTVDVVREAVRQMAKDPEQRAALRALARGAN